MLQLDNFLVAFSLEVGGKFIGFFALITNSIVLPLAILLLIAVSIDKDFQYLREQLELMEIQIFNIPEASNEKALKHLREYVMVSLVLLIIISTIYIIAAYLLIRGTTNRNPRQIKPAKNILLFLAVFSTFGLFMRFTMNAMFNVALYIYLFAVINSLWKKFRDEEENGQRPVTVAAQFYPVAIQPKV